MSCRTSFSTEVRDPNTSTGFIVFECDDDKNLETLSNEEEDTRDEKIEPSHHEDEEPQEYGADTDGALAIHEEPKVHGGDVWISKLLDLKYIVASLAEVILHHTKKHQEGRHGEE